MKLKGTKGWREIQGKRIEISVPSNAFDTIKQHLPDKTEVRVWRTMLWAVCVRVQWLLNKYQ